LCSSVGVSFADFPLFFLLKPLVQLVALFLSASFSFLECFCLSVFVSISVAVFLGPSLGRAFLFSRLLSFFPFYDFSLLTLLGFCGILSFFCKYHFATGVVFFPPLSDRSFF